MQNLVLRPTRGKRSFSHPVKRISSPAPPRPSIPGWNDVPPGTASASLSSRANLLSVHGPFAAPSITAAPATLSPSSTIAATSPSPSGSRAPSSMALVAGSLAREATFMAATPFDHLVNIRWRFVCVFYSLPRPWTSALRGPSYVTAAT